MSNIPRLCFDGERLYVGLMMKDILKDILVHQYFTKKSYWKNMLQFRYSKFKIDPRFAEVLPRSHQTLGINYIHDPARLAT